MTDVLLLKIANLTTAVYRRVRNRLLTRIFTGAKSVVWELPYSHPEVTKGLITTLNTNFIDALKRLVLLVNNESENVILIGVFDERLWSIVQTQVNNIPNVMQSFVNDPMVLVAMATHGYYHMAVSNVNPSTVDELYEKG